MSSKSIKTSVPPLLKSLEPIRLLMPDFRQHPDDSLWRHGLSCFRYEVDSDGNLNPTLLQIAKYGHYLESQVLEISAELHMFGTGNPCFEVHQAAAVAVIIVSMALFLFWQMTYLVLLYFNDMPLLNYLGMAVILLGSDVGFMMLAWLVAVATKEKRRRWADRKAPSLK
jgi:hypothetical protein